jgi:hypothetical protein
VQRARDNDALDLGPFRGRCYPAIAQNDDGSYVVRLDAELVRLTRRQGRGRVRSGGDRVGHALEDLALSAVGEKIEVERHALKELEAVRVPPDGDALERGVVRG